MEQALLTVNRRKNSASEIICCRKAIWRVGTAALLVTHFAKAIFSIIHWAFNRNIFRSQLFRTRKREFISKTEITRLSQLLILNGY